MTSKDNELQELFNVGAHLGHKTQRVHPKAKKYIYKIENSVSIIDLTQTLTQFEKAKKFVADLGQENKTLLVVATKKVAASTARDLCQKNHLSYITVKWPAGLFTNFEMIIKNVKKLKQMREEKNSGEWEKYVKHEQLQLKKELNRLEKFYGGIADLEKLPDAIFVVDIRKEKNAVTEANVKNIPTVAIVDTNSDPDMVDYPIVANDDSLSSIEYIVKQIIETFAKGRKK